MEEDDFSLCVLDNARKAARAVSRHYDKLARQVDMTPGQFSVLVSIHKYEGATTAELAEQLSMERTTLVRNVALVERKGLVASQLVPDGRSKQYRLTPKGVDLLNRILPLWRRAQADVKDHLGSDEFLRAINTLKRLSEL
ncbi:winged helix-turn-helix transcriptional regulator [Stappia sp. BW2]|jgi:DNA-binding MarR family transcriptional regulator|uniref:MarR family winged helix-turn-helix transcriptional regulator n=1 Tax=Stappia sp. BW2 TaxID=2592622 RepID=UPI0011DEB196|nr:MarR family winged helix-turn-helix transcriptional regulator [Stappia sp. BW2]TYC67274.1 winged helix-turn-helix transcriptional regulator [Stappia sp. BW2]